MGEYWRSIFSKKCYSKSFLGILKDQRVYSPFLKNFLCFSYIFSCSCVENRFFIGILYNFLFEISAPIFFSFLKIALTLQSLKHSWKLLEIVQAFLNFSSEILIISFLTSIHSPGSTKPREKFFF